MEITIWSLILVFGLPTSITALGLWSVQRTITKNEKVQDEREKAREKHQVMIIRGMSASLALGEATACAIRDGQCNGEVSGALEYARKAKHEQKEFLEEQAIKNLI
jgi:hypothetical protein